MVNDARFGGIGAQPLNSHFRVGAASGLGVDDLSQ